MPDQFRKSIRKYPPAGPQAGTRKNLEGPLPVVCDCIVSKAAYTSRNLLDHHNALPPKRAGSVNGMSVFTNAAMPARYAPMMIHFCAGLCWMASVSWGKPMRLQKTCDRIGGRTLPVRRKRKAAWKPNREV